MNEVENYLFDTHGYLLIEAALSTDELAAANAAIDAHADQINIRRVNDLANRSSTLVGEHGRGDLGGMLTWDAPHCEIFRHLLAHPRLTPYLEALCGPGFRSEGISLITMDKGAEGFWFHEGGEPHDRARDYLYRNGRMYCGMTNLAIQFADVGPGDGGFACLPGSHKSNYPCPDEIRLYEAHQDRMVQPVARAGDVLIFVETLMHGSLPWRGEHQRRTAILRYNNGVTANSMMGTWTPPEFFEELTDAQKAVISAPHHRGEDKGSKLYKTQGK